MGFIKYLLQVIANQIAWLVVHVVNWENVEREARRIDKKGER